MRTNAAAIAMLLQKRLKLYIVCYNIFRNIDANFDFSLWKCRKVSEILKEGEGKPLLKCRPHLCPVGVHWHIKYNYKGYWRVKITIFNFEYRMKYTQWSLVVQHPNLNNVSQVYSFNYMPLPSYESISKFFEIETTF